MPGDVDGITAPMTAHIVRTFKYALRLNAVERRTIARELERGRLLYNAAHQERQDAWRWACGQAALLGLARPDREALVAMNPAALDDKRRAAHAALVAWRSPDFMSQKAAMALKAQVAVLGEVVHEAASVVTRWALDRLDAAWRAFFERCAGGATPGFPRFRPATRWRSWGCHELADDALLRPTGEVIGSRALGFLSVPGMARPLAVRMHRMLPEGAEVRSCSFTRGPGDRWTVALACRVPVEHGCETDAQLAGITPDEILAYDGGVAWQATDSSGTRYGNAREGEHRAKATRRHQRKLGRARKGSRNRARAKERLARTRRKEADARLTASRRNAARLVEAALSGGKRAIAREDLALARMTRSAAGTAAEPGAGVAQKRGLNRAIADAALARFAKDVEGKAGSAGLRVIAVDPRRTSLTCSCCGVVDARSLGERTYRCVACGRAMDRDHNAAVNIGRRAAALHAPGPAGKPAARRGRRSCVSEPRSTIPVLGRDGARHAA